VCIAEGSISFKDYVASVLNKTKELGVEEAAVASLLKESYCMISAAPEYYSISISVADQMDPASLVRKTDIPLTQNSEK
jgi:hypothetical protein